MKIPFSVRLSPNYEPNSSILADGGYHRGFEIPLIAALRLRRYDRYDQILKNIEPGDFRYPRPCLTIECADPHMIRHMLLARPYADRDIGAHRIRETIRAAFQQGSPTIIRIVLNHYAGEGFDILDEDVLLDAAQAPSLAALRVMLKPGFGHELTGKHLDRILLAALWYPVRASADSEEEAHRETLLPPRLIPDDAIPPIRDHHDMERHASRLLLYRKVRLLLDAGASPDAMACDHAAPVLNRAVELGQTAAARLLLWRGAKTENELTSALRYALCEGQWPAIQMLVRHGYSFDECTEDTFWLNDRSAHLLDKIPWTDSRLRRFIRLATEQPEAAQYLLAWPGLPAEHRDYLENNPGPTWEKFLEFDPMIEAPEA